MFLAFWHYLRGYVIIKISGFSTERFMNLAANKGIYLWDIKPSGTGITMKVSLDDFWGLKDCGKRTKCKIVILKKRGFPFIIGRYKRRKFYTAGIFIFVMALYAMSSFVWTVNVKGNERVAEEEIIDFCRLEGLYVGQLKYRLDNKALTKRLIASFSDISWVAITTKGTDVTITVVETLPKVTVEDTEVPTDIVSSKTCVIESISVSRGTPLVKAGDVVDQGDILVSSEISIKDMDVEVGKKYVHSKAYIKGKSLTLKENEYSLKYTEKVYTGEEKTDKILVVGNYRINLLSPNLKGTWEKSGENRKTFSVGEKNLPFAMVTEEFSEFKEEEKQRTEEEAKTLLIEDIEKFKQELEFNGAEIIETKTDIINEYDTVKSRTVFSVIEDIGIEQKIEEKGDPNINE